MRKGVLFDIIILSGGFLRCLHIRAGSLLHGVHATTLGCHECCADAHANVKTTESIGNGIKAISASRT
eukprot:154251-Amphidinium_carterae.1